MKTIQMPVIEIKGTPYERGYKYGDVARSLISQVLLRWKANLGRFSAFGDFIGHNDADKYLDSFLYETNFVESIQKYSPALFEEIKGIADGAQQPLDLILALNLMDEEWVFGLHRKLVKPVSKCTAFALPKQSDGYHYAGQNMDIPAWVEGNQVLLRIMATSSTPEILAFSIAGCIGLNGLNARGVGVTCNTLAQLRNSMDGVPVLFIVRLILEKNSVDEAESLLRSIPHASGQSYILSSHKKALCLECSSDSVIPYASKNLNGSFFHTNHPLINDDISQPIAIANLIDTTNSEARYNSIESRLGKTQSNSLKDIKRALAAHDNPEHPVSRMFNDCDSTNPISYTAGSSIYQFGDSPRLHFAAGPPCITDFQPFDFTDIS